MKHECHLWFGQVWLFWGCTWLQQYWSHPNLEAGHTQTLKFQRTGPELKPRTTCSETQKLRNYTVAAPQCRLWQTRGPLSLNCEPDYNVPQLGMEYMLIMIGLKNTNLVEDVKYSPLVKFPLIPFGGWKEEVKYVSANQRPGQSCSFSNQQEKHRLVGGHSVLDSYQVSLNSVQLLQRRDKKCLSQSEAWARQSWFSNQLENTNLVKDHEISLPFKFPWILLSNSKAEAKNVSANQGSRQLTWFFYRQKSCERKLSSCLLSSFVEFCSAVAEKKSKISRPIRGQDGRLGFLIGPNNINLVEDVKIMLPVFCSAVSEKLKMWKVKDGRTMWSPHSAQVH